MKRWVTLVLALVVLGAAAAQAGANIIYPVDYHYRWWGPYAGGWETIYDPLGWGPPMWEDEGLSLWVPNVEMPPPWHKDFYWEVVYYDPPPTLPPDALLWPADAPFPVPPSVKMRGPNDWTLIWRLPTQPYYEFVLFQDPRYYNGEGFWYFDLASRCVPEPTTVGLLALGGLAVFARRRR